mgnify:CR=1 FL=1
MAVKCKVVHAKEIENGMVSGSDNLSQHHWMLGKGMTEDSFAGIWTHEPGCRTPQYGWKWHDDEEIEYIVQGEMTLYIADAEGNQVESHDLRKGDLFFIGKGVKHAADYIGEENCIGLLFCPKAYELPQGQPAWSDLTEDPAGWTDKKAKF